MFEPVSFEESPFVLRKGTSQTRRILIVDDDDGILQSLSQLLRLTFPDCKIATAATAEDAVTLVKMAPVDLVITDLKLPTIDGLELTKRLRMLTSTTRFILMTAYGSEEIMQSAHDNGCIAYLEKPFDIDLLLKYVEVAIRPYNDLKVEVTGLGVLDMIELYVRKALDVVLTVTSAGSSGMVVIENGLLTHAQYDAIDGMDALRLLLGCKTGLVTSLPYKPPHQPTLSIGLKEIQALANEPPQSSSVGNFSFNVQSTRSSAVRSSHAPKNINEPDDLRRQRVASDPNSASTLDPTLNEPLELHAQSDSVVLIKEAQVKKLVQDGIAFFKAKQFEEAGYCWDKALRLDPDCVSAKKNLQLLEKAVNESDPVH